MSDNGSLTTNRDDRVAEVLDAYLEALKGGGTPDTDALLARYPDLADDLKECLASLAFIRHAELSANRDPGEGEAMSPADSHAGVLGDFRIVREVGKGGMGVVYEAEQISLRRRVALKVLPFAATMDARHLQRFHHEAQAAACLHHTNIVPVFSVGCERGVHFYAMQFIDGQPLSELIHQMRQREKKAPTVPGEEPTVVYRPPADADAITPQPAVAITPLTGEGRRGRDYFRKVAELGVQGAEALDHAHQLGIVHRDIKPGNLLLDSSGRLWVTDFGLAHMQQSDVNLTITGQVLGTPRYMSPEQALAERVPIDHRTDVFSLGGTLYELLILRPAFTSEDRQELLQQIALEDPPRPCRLERAIPAELEIIVLKAMEKRPQDRYATAQELADDLRHWLSHEPIRARRPSLVQRVAKWGRRHQAVVGTALCFLVLTLVVLAAGTIMTWRAYHAEAEQRRRAEDRFRRACEAVEHLHQCFASEQELHDLPPMQKLRRDALVEVLKFYQGFLQEKSTDPSARYETAYAYRRVGDIQLNLLYMNDERNEARRTYFSQKVKEAEDAYREAQDRQEALVADFPRDPKYGAELATLYMKMSGHANLQKQPKEAEKLIRQCVDLREQLVADFPREANYRADLIVAYESLAGQMSREKEKRQEAERLHRRALELSEGLVADDPSSIARGLGLAGRIGNLRSFYDQFGPPEKAEAVWQRERAQMEELAARFPGDREVTNLPMERLLERANRLRRKRRYAEAEKVYDHALPLAEKLAADKTQTPYRRSRVSYTLVCLGDLFRETGRPRDAKQAYRRAVSLAETLLAGSPTATSYKEAWVKSWSRLAELLTVEGRRPEAIQAYRGILSTLEGIGAQHNVYPEYEFDLKRARSRLMAMLVSVRDYRGAAELQQRIVDELEERAGKSKEPGPRRALCQNLLKLAELLRSAGKTGMAEQTERRGLSLVEAGLAAPVELSPSGQAAGYTQWTLPRGNMLLRRWWGRAYDLFYLARVYWRLGEKEKARDRYAKAVQLKDKNDPQNQMLLPLHLDTAVLLGIKQLGQLDERLSAVLKGNAKLKGGADYVTFAMFCQLHRKEYAAAARLFKEGFAAQPALADNLNAQHRYNAACAAALAACGLGGNADKVDTEERARLHRQALDWLRADLKAYQQILEKSAGKAGPAIAQRMQHWLKDDDFAGVRGEQALAKLPETERKAWRKLWEEVEALRQTATKQPKQKGSAQS